MNLPTSKAKAAYAAEIKIIEANLEAATAGHQDDHLLSLVQKRLDRLAEKYQYDQTVGEDRYKMYELQALVHYFNGNDRDAYAFINTAIDMRGESYPRAEKLLNQLGSDDYEDTPTDPNDLPLKERRRQLIGLEGWLALFIVGQFIALLLTVVNLFKDGLLLSSSEVDTLNQYQSGLGDSLQILSNIENLFLVGAIGLIITTLTLLFRKKKLARAFAISTLAYLAIYSVLDYAIASSVFESADLTQFEGVSEAMSEVAETAGRNILAACIWIPYFLLSRRVKRTLVR